MSPFMATTGRAMQLPSAFENPMHVTQSAEVEKMAEVDKVIKEARDEAAERYKDQYDKGRDAQEFAAGDKVWWREHDVTALQPKRTGPYVIKRVVSKLDYELEELPQGPKIGRRHSVVNIQHLERFEAAEIREAEEVVEKIVNHRRRSRPPCPLACAGDVDSPRPRPEKKSYMPRKFSAALRYSLSPRK